MLDLEMHEIKLSERFGWDIYHKTDTSTRLGYIPQSLPYYWLYHDPNDPNKEVNFYEIPSNIKEYLKLSII